MLNNYESMVIFSPSFSEEEVKKENEKILNFIKENEGEVTELDFWGKRNLAYEIGDFKEAYYFVNYYKLAPHLITKLENFLKLNEVIIRFNILVKE